MASWQYDIKADAVVWPEAMEEMYGFEPGEFKGRFAQMRDRIHPDDRPRWQESVLACLDEGGEHRVDFRIIGPGGRIHWLSELGEVVRDEDGRPLGMISLAMDRTERMEAMEEIAKLAQFPAENPYPVLRIGEKGDILYANRASGCLLDLWRCRDGGLVPSRWRTKVREALESGSIQSGETACGDMIFHLSLAPLSESAYVNIYAVDITESKRSEKERAQLGEQLRQAQKMEAVGQLAGGVAHDFNNILQAMHGYAQLLIDQLPRQSEEHEFARELLQGTVRAAALTRQLLAFSRRQHLDEKKLFLNEIIENLLKLIVRTIGENIELTFRPTATDPEIFADQGQIEQVLMNLCVNARDAMPDGGRLLIETDRVSIDEEFCISHPWAEPGNYAIMEVSDTGCGMDEVTKLRIFEPFFTTKETGKGTGLGLATVFGVVTQHKGMIHVYSEEGHGATFKVYLPILEKEVGREREMEVPLRRGSETILLAEDEDAVRRLIKRLLNQAGYRVFMAENGIKAIELLERHHREIDLVLLDVVMPKKSGRDVADRFRALRRDGKVLFMSGYSIGVIDDSFLERNGMAFIQKPFSTPHLLDKIRELLDSNSSSPEK